MLSTEVFRARARPAGLLRNEVLPPGEEEGEVCHARLDIRKNRRCLDSGFLLLLYRKERRQRAWGGAAITSSSSGAAFGIRETDDGQGAGARF